MSTETVEEKSTTTDAAATATLQMVNDMRDLLAQVRSMAENLRNTAGGKCIARELSLVATEAQSARHWTGECLGILVPQPAPIEK